MGVYPDAFSALAPALSEVEGVGFHGFGNLGDFSNRNTMAAPPFAIFEGWEART